MVEISHIKTENKSNYILNAKFGKSAPIVSVDRRFTKSPSAKRSKKHKPLNRFLIYRRNYTASFPLDKKPNFKKITKETSAKWMSEESARLRLHIWTMGYPARNSI